MSINSLFAPEEYGPVDYNEASSRSNRCKTECIDNDLNYCINDNMDGGMCCDVNEPCEKFSICSEDNPSAPKMFKYMACPNEQACGTKYITPQMTGAIVRAQNTYDYNYVQNDVCSYIIQQPIEMTDSDIMHLEISDISNAIVYVHKTVSGKYRWFSHMDDYIAEFPIETTKYEARIGIDFYIVGVGLNQFKANYKIKTWIGTGEAVPDRPPIIVTEAENAALRN